MTHRIVVLGAGYAGLMAAKRTARRLRHTDARVTLVNAGDRFVERVRLHQLAAGQRLRDLPLADLLAGTGVELVPARVTGVDAGARTVRIDTAPYVLEYDTLVYALGSVAETASVPGAAEHASAVAGHDDAVRLRGRLASAAPDRPVVVVGGGLTGIELVAELAEAPGGPRPLLVSGGELGAGLSERGRVRLRLGLDRLGVPVREHARVVRVGADRLELADGSDLPAALTVWAAGFGVSPIAAESGLAVDGRGLITVDDRQRSTSHPEVYAVGDAAAALGPDGRPSRMSCQTALPMGFHVANGIADLLTGRTPGPLRLRYAWQNISLGRRDGVTQFVRADDTALGAAVLTGRSSARLKETVTRATVFALRHPGPVLRPRRTGPTHRPEAGTGPAADRESSR
ncbi:NAD(P)/FAD-dependent oxidoreductase [Embleya sp. NPDC020886]|uniref:NAD(P)/FAD-dependent oxidoreductase n=1 Tax=Embleya sp. NPDC020886 TaxID=3363980 RepID=UPI00379BF87C